MSVVGALARPDEFELNPVLERLRVHRLAVDLQTVII